MASSDDREATLLRTWGAVIRRYRQWKHLSRRDLARQAGISTVYLGEIERGEKDPSSRSLGQIADALDVPLAELYLRVAALLDTRARDSERQNALPLAMREAADDYLDGVPLIKDETAFDVYKIVRRLRTDQQLSLLMLARSLEPEPGE